jgi:hypothetical protein
MKIQPLLIILAFTVINFEVGAVVPSQSQDDKTIECKTNFSKSGEQVVENKGNDIKDNKYTMKKVPIKPEMVLADGESNVMLHGISGRKGSIAAFLQNIDMLEQSNLSDQERQDVIKVMEELASVLIATGLYKHATFKNQEVQDILNKVAQATK